MNRGVGGNTRRRHESAMPLQGSLSLPCQREEACYIYSKAVGIVREVRSPESPSLESRFQRLRGCACKRL